MRFYGARWEDSEPTAGNVEWFTNRRDAERYTRDGDVEVLDVPTDKAGLLAFLNRELWRR